MSTGNSGARRRTRLPGRPPARTSGGPVYEGSLMVQSLPLITEAGSLWGPRRALFHRNLANVIKRSQVLVFSLGKNWTRLIELDS